MSSFETEVLVRAEDSSNQLGIVVNTIPAGWGGPPLHHHDFDEAFYVLAGEPTFQLEDELHPATPGTFVFAPRGSWHTLANHGDTDARYLLVITPGGFERYFDRMTEHPPASASKPFPETIVVGPQIDAGAPVGAPIVVPEGPIRVLAHGELTGGAVAVIDTELPAGASGSDLHTHDFAEACYVTEGELVFQRDTELLCLRAGEIAFAPGGVPHAFANRGGAVARFAQVFAPAGFERHIARLASEDAGVTAPAWTSGWVPNVTRVGDAIA